jgi:drug/metabolite transporter (DMT)-like permease
MNKVGLLSFRPSLFFPTLWHAFTTPQVIIGFACAFVAAIFWLAVISRVPLSYAYPMLSLSYVVVIFASWLLLGENFSFTRLIGVFIICSGVYVVFRS